MKKTKPKPKQAASSHLLEDHSTDPKVIPKEFTILFNSTGDHSEHIIIAPNEAKIIDGATKQGATVRYIIKQIEHIKQLAPCKLELINSCQGKSDYSEESVISLYRAGEEDALLPDEFVSPSDGSSTLFCCIEIHKILQLRVNDDVPDDSFLEPLLQTSHDKYGKHLALGNINLEISWEDVWGYVGVTAHSLYNSVLRVLHRLLSSGGLENFINIQLVFKINRHSTIPSILETLKSLNKTCFAKGVGLSISLDGWRAHPLAAMAWLFDLKIKSRLAVALNDPDTISTYHTSVLCCFKAYLEDHIRIESSQGHAFFLMLSNHYSDCEMALILVSYLSKIAEEKIPRALSLHQIVGSALDKISVTLVDDPIGFNQLIASCGVLDPQFHNQGPIYYYSLSCLPSTELLLNGGFSCHNSFHEELKGALISMVGFIVSVATMGLCLSYANLGEKTRWDTNTALVILGFVSLIVCIFSISYAYAYKSYHLLTKTRKSNIPKLLSFFLENKKYLMHHLESHLDRSDMLPPGRVDELILVGSSTEDDEGGSIKMEQEEEKEDETPEMNGTEGRPPQFRQGFFPPAGGGAGSAPDERRQGSLGKRI